MRVTNSPVLDREDGLTAASSVLPDVSVTESTRIGPIALIQDAQRWGRTR